MASLPYITETPGARVLIVSQRQVLPIKSRCIMLEFEDLIASIDAVDIISSGELASSRPARIAAKLGRHRLWPTGLDHARGFPTTRQYELVLFICNSPPELCRFGHLRSFHGVAGRSAGYFEEIWNLDLEKRRGELEMLRGFDFHFVGMKSSVARLRELTGKNWMFLPAGVNTDVLSPGLPLPQPRIDVWAMGRRRPELHEALREVARRTGRLYLYDTTGNDKVPDYRAHRALFAELAHRARYFCVDHAKADVPWMIGDQEEIGSRFYEGAAAGTVMVGRVPQCEGFRERFDWEDSVISLPSTAEEIIDLFDMLDADTARVERIRRRNIAQSLRRHDGAYRWASILETVGMQPLPALQSRLDLLQQRARAIDPDVDPHRNTRSGAAARDVAHGSSATPLGVS